MSLLSRAFSGLLLAVLFLQTPPMVGAASFLQATRTNCAIEYTIQVDDWLSKLAIKYLGDGQAYPAIATATNQQRAVDGRFAHITNPDLIEVGWLVCIPGSGRTPPTPAPVTWQPLPMAECRDLSQALAGQLGVTFHVTTANFYADEPFDGRGTGCQVSAEATNQVWQVEDGLDLTARMEAVLSPRGWVLDPSSQFAAGALSEMSGNYNQTSGQCQLHVIGQMAPGVRCGEGLSPTGCFYELPPDQQIYSVQLTCARPGLP